MFLATMTNFDFPHMHKAMINTYERPLTIGVDGHVASYLPNFVKKIGLFFTKLFCLRRLSLAIGSTLEKDLEGIHKLNHDIKVKRQEWHEKMKEVQVLIMPGYFHCALKREHKKKLAVQATYMLFQNLLDQPAGVLPVSTVTKEEESEVYRDQYMDAYTKEIDQDIKGSMGMPIGV